MASGTAFAGKTSEAEKLYKQERAKCMSGESNQDRATCLKEAGAAFAEAKKASSTSAGDGDRARNRLKRCEGLPATDRDECVTRMNEGTTSGSAQQGGMLRELSTTKK